MLLNDLLLAKSGPLAKIWLSATQEKKLTKSHVTSIDLSRSVEAILARGGGAAEAHQNGNGNEDVNMDAREGEEDQVHVDVPVYAQQGGEVGEGEGMVLRMSGQLMLGVVRIYGRKAQYLMDDAKDVRDRITMVSGSGGFGSLFSFFSFLAPLISPLFNFFGDVDADDLSHSSPIHPLPR